jgi:hypothetical protein
MSLIIFLISLIGIAVFAAVKDYIDFQHMMGVADIRYELDQLYGDECKG